MILVMKTCSNDDIIMTLLILVIKITYTIYSLTVINHDSSVQDLGI